MTSTSPFSPTVRTFVAEHIGSVGELELLLLLRDEPSREWTASDAAARLHHLPDWVRVQMERLVERGLAAVRSAGGEAVYRFAPASATLERSVEAVAEAFRGRRTSMISLIYSAPPGPARLADAFRLRDDES
jgi:hypothetical protein